MTGCDLTNAEMKKMSKELAERFLSFERARPIVQQVAQDMVRLHGGKPWPCKCFHCVKARTLLRAIGIAPQS